mgnify:FL=1
MELKLLKLFTNKNIYNRYIKYINKDYIEDITIKILEDFNTYYSTFGAVDNINLEEYNSFVFSILHPKMKEENKTQYQKVLDNLKTIGAVEEGILSFFREKELYSTLVEKALWGLEKGTSIIPEIEDLLRKHKGFFPAEDGDSLVKEDMFDLAERVVGGTGLNWRLHELNKAMGPLRPGNFIVVGARPETGKTTFLASETTYMQQFLEPGQKVVWFNNEEDGKKVLWRVIQAALGWTKDQMLVDLSATYAAYLTCVGESGKILVYDNAVITARIIEDTLEKHSPGLIIFDQLRKVHGFGGETDVLRLQKLFQFAREIAKKWAPVINVHQADGSAEGERYIHMNQLYGSKTDIQGEADAILTIGRSHEDHLENNRFLFLPKNKLSGGPLSEEQYRHGKFEVLIDRERCRFYSP